MNTQTAIDNANLIQYAYSIPPTDLINRAGTSINVAGKTYKILATIYADDLSTTLNPTGKPRSHNVFVESSACQAAMQSR